MSKEAYYFSHDANARHDPKILAMRSEYGVNGYGVYWIIVEMLREQDNFKLPLKKYIWNAIAMQVQCKEFAKDDANKFVLDCIDEYELFASDGDYFWSESLLKRMEKKNNLSEKRRKAAQKRWQKPHNGEGYDENNDDEENKKDANAMQVHANAMQVDARKGKEIKEKEIKRNNITSHKFEICDKENAQLLFDMMQENNPNVKKPNLDKWANEFRLMRERDQRQDDHIKYMIEWTQNDDFWSSNILSPSKLRKQWDQLYLKAKKDFEDKRLRIGTHQKQNSVDINRLMEELGDE